MIFTIPPLTDADHGVLDLIGRQRERLRGFTIHNPRRWFGSLRRTTFARAIQGSNSIEGYNASMDDAVAAVDAEAPMDERTEIWQSIRGYRDALTYIMQASQDQYFDFGKQFLKSLQFMMVGFDMSKRPGQWREGPIFVINTGSGETVYEGPDAELIDDLVQELVDGLRSEKAAPNIVRAAMAHLNLTMIHPFRDGNGRMARAIQTLVLSRDGLLHPVFCSIEEWLGRNTQEYYDVLALVGKGAWNPHHDASPWVKFCLKAHYQQAATLIRRNGEYENLWARIQTVVQDHRLPDRAALPLFDAALGLSLTNTRYRQETELTEFMASRDLKRLSDVGLLEPKGGGRGRTYSAARPLVDIRNSVRIRMPLNDPYDLVARRRQAAREPRLPGI